jgi:hypothetical protein
MSRYCAGNLSLCPALVDHLFFSLVLRYRPTLYPFPSYQPFPGASTALATGLSLCQHFSGMLRIGRVSMAIRRLSASIDQLKRDPAGQEPA